MTSRSPRMLGLLAVAMVVASCGMRTSTRVVTTPVPDMVGRPTARITVLGVSGLRGWTIGLDLEAESARLLAESLRVRNAAVTVSAPPDDRDLLEQAGLGSAWATLTEIWLETGIADATLLRDMADAVGADAILGGTLLTDETPVVYSADVEIGWLSRPKRRVITVRLWLFDTRDGDLLWEAAAESTTYGPPPVSLADALMGAIENITTKLPRLATQSMR